MKTVVTGALVEFREAIRHLWNVSLSGKRRAGVQEVIDFYAVEKPLFRFMVLKPIGLDKSDAEYALSAIRQLTICPRTPRTQIEAYKRREDGAGNYYWDQRISFKEFFESITFVDFFDWDAYGQRDYALVRCELKGHPNLEDGTIVMMDFSDVEVFR